MGPHKKQGNPPFLKQLSELSFVPGSHVAGVGVDIIRISRVSKAYQRRPARFLERIFSSREQAALAQKNFPITSLAARFAGKEAVAKALGCGIGPVRWHELEILQGKNGMPFISLSGRAALLAQQHGIDAVNVSLSHEGSWAIAFAVAYKKQEVRSKKQEAGDRKQD